MGMGGGKEGPTGCFEVETVERAAGSFDVVYPLPFAKVRCVYEVPNPGSSSKNK